MKTYSLLNPFSPDSNFDNFFGREKELKLLENSFIKEKHKVVVISGNNAVGKTALWRVFLHSQTKIFDGKVQVFSAAPRFEGFPKIDDNIKLVVIDDISYDFNDRLEKDILDLLKIHTKKQFLLVGANE